MDPLSSTKWIDEINKQAKWKFFQFAGCLKFVELNQNHTFEWYAHSSLSLILIALQTIAHYTLLCISHGHSAFHVYEPLHLDIVHRFLGKFTLYIFAYNLLHVMIMLHCSTISRAICTLQREIESSSFHYNERSQIKSGISSKLRDGQMSTMNLASFVAYIYFVIKFGIMTTVVSLKPYNIQMKRWIV